MRSKVYFPQVFFPPSPGVCICTKIEINESSTIAWHLFTKEEASPSCSRNLNESFRFKPRWESPVQVSMPGKRPPSHDPGHERDHSPDVVASSLNLRSDMKCCMNGHIECRTGGGEGARETENFRVLVRAVLSLSSSMGRFTRVRA